MKPQDILFVLVLGFLIYRSSPRFSAFVGMICLLVSIPLFAYWVFFTAERLTMYAVGFFLLSVVQYAMIVMKRKK